MQALSGGAGAYALTEAANVSPLQQALIAINAPVLAATGRPLIGNGANGTRARTAGPAAMPACCSPLPGAAATADSATPPAAPAGSAGMPA